MSEPSKIKVRPVLDKCEIVTGRGVLSVTYLFTIEETDALIDELKHAKGQAKKYLSQVEKQ